MRAYCRACDAAVDAAGDWPGTCKACGAAIEANPVPDVIAPRLRILFVGINPGTITARERRHFANPRNAFWGALHESGLTPRRLAPHEHAALLALRLGITNAVTRATPGSADVTREDVAHGAATLRALVQQTRPGWLAFVGKEAHRMATGKRAVELGEQDERFEESRVFVLPSTSPRNAHWTEAEKVAWFVKLKDVTP